MKSFPIQILKKGLGLLFAGSFILMGCNKELPNAVPIPRPTDVTTPTLASLLDAAEYSILKSAVTKAGLMTNLANPANRFTIFAPNNDAFIASGVSQAVVDALPVAQVAGIVSYHVVPQLVNAASIPTTFPNLQYPTLINPAPAISALLRLTTFPSKRGSNVWVNNIPVIAAEQIAANGIVHKVARVVAPPTQFLWDRINTDPNLTYMKAAIQRADSGSTAASSLEGFLKNIGANFTVFAPTDAAFKATLTGAITLALIAQGMPPATAQATAAALAASPTVFSNPALYGALSATIVKGIAVYHLLGTRAFSVNLPTTATSVPTLLNGAIAAHPGLSITATFGPAGVTAATVKGLGNMTASNVQINPLPAGTSDQHYLNGVLHIIDQVLLPQ